MKNHEHIWTTKAGEKISVKEMTYDHLKNTHKLLQKSSHSIDFAIDTMPDGLLPATAIQEQRNINHWLRIIKTELEVRERFKDVEEGSDVYEHCW